MNRTWWLMGGSWAVAPKEWDDGGGLYEQVEPVGQVWQWEDIVFRCMSNGCMGLQERTVRGGWT